MSTSGILEIEQEDSKKTKHTYLHKGNNFSQGIIDTPLYSEELMEQYFAGIASNIMIEMDKKDMSMRGLSTITGISIPHISRILKNEAKPGTEILIKIAFALEVSPTELFPVDINKRKTPGERYDEITKGLDVKSNNFLLNHCAEYVKMYKEMKYK